MPNACGFRQRARDTRSAHLNSIIKHPFFWTTRPTAVGRTETHHCQTQSGRVRLRRGPIRHCKRRPSKQPPNTLVQGQSRRELPRYGVRRKIEQSLAQLLILS